jgi:6-phosphogluconolactonase (cycloisomerase 2 family)
MLARLARMATVAGLALAFAAPSAHAGTPTAFVYATSSNPTLAPYAIGDGGALNALTPALAPGLATSTGVAASPNGRTLYVVDQPTNDVSQYAIGDDGTLTPKSPATVTTGATPFGIAVAPDGRHVYVANQDGNSISVFTVRSDGTLMPNAGTVDAGAGPVAIALAPDGSSAYVTNAGDGTISEYDVDAADGSLTSKGDPVPATGVPFAIAVSTDGHSVYVTNRQSPGFVGQYSVGAGGELTPMTPATVAAGTRPAGILATATGVYVTNFADDTLTRYTAGADGALTAQTNVATPHNPFGMALAPDGHGLYVAGFGAGRIGQYDVGADGSLTAKAPADVAADTRPVAIAAVQPLEQQAPTIDLRTPADGAQFDQGADIAADYSCADDGGSGLASCTGDVPDGAALDTSTPGSFNFIVVARDGAGNATTVTHSYSVVAKQPGSTFEGFVGPIHDGSVVRGGSVVPIAFSLGGDRGLDVLADGSPSSVQVDCRHPGDPTGGRPAQSENGLQFHETTGHYTFAWQTRSSWAGTCRAFIVTLSDGSVERLVVNFRSVCWSWRPWRHHP